MVSIACTASDALSGVANPDCGGTAGDAYTFPLGANTVTRSTTDRAGNGHTASVTFTVQVTYASLCALTRRWVSKDGVAHSLCVKLDNAEKSAARVNANAKAGQIGAYINEVKAQRGKAIAADKADILIALARAL